MSVEAGFTFKNGWFVSADEVASLPAQDHYNLGLDALNQRKWDEAAYQFKIVSVNFSTTPIGKESLYYLGVAYYYLNELDFSNDAFTTYLKSMNNPRFFKESIEYKFAIAEQFRFGAKRRFWGTKQLPKWACGLDLAIDIYDEVIMALPCHELAARSMFAKGMILWQLKDYSDSIDVYQTLTKKFPKHELAPESYLVMSRIYLEQSRIEFQNPDILAFAQINLRRFQQAFPREERLCEAEQIVREITEVYAKGFYDTGCFYERKDKPRASIIYYENVVKQFPDTSIAELCRERLEQLRPQYSPK